MESTSFNSHHGTNHVDTAALSSSRNVTVSAIQFACTSNIPANLMKAEQLVRAAAGEGADIILLQELFSSLYFPIDHAESLHLSSENSENNGFLNKFKSLASELEIVLPISFYERSKFVTNAHSAFNDMCVEFVRNVFFNSVKVFDADGTDLGIYRKSHIPDGPGYQEKYYFSPGNTGFRTFKTKFGTIGVGICWDQWFPEAARCMVLQGAEILFYPTAIGSEPHNPDMDTQPQWRRCIQGHAVANHVPTVVSNRIGKEVGNEPGKSITFYGSSFITDHLGAIVEESSRCTEGIILHTINLDDVRKERTNWGIFRDRRPELYKPICSLDGDTEQNGQ